MADDAPAAAVPDAAPAPDADAAPKLKKKKPNRLVVEEASNDDNSVVALNTATMEVRRAQGPHTRAQWRTPPPTA